MSTTTDLSRVSVRDLPAGIEHIEGERHATVRRIREGERSGEFHRATPVYITRDGTVWCRVKRHRPAPRPRSPWVAPVLVLSGLLGTAAGAGYGIYLLTLSILGAVRQVAMPLGGLATVGLVVLGAAGLMRLGGGGRRISGTFEGTIK